VLLFGGGIIPKDDIPKLREKGIEQIFTPGTPTSAIVEWLRARLGKEAS
jgi:methylmalonyl-CoA mutase C-terminal domain/subunit